MIKYILSFSLIIWVFIHSDAQVASIIDETLPNKIGVGTHSANVKSISSLLASALTSHASSDVFRYKNVTSVEYYSGSSWVPYSTTAWKNVLDATNSTRWSVPYETVRFVIDLGGSWIRPSAILIGQDWQAGERQYNLKVESSPDQQTWNLRLGDTPSGTSYARTIFMIDNQTEVDRYIRLTITSTTDLGDPLSLFCVSGFSQRSVGLKDNTSLPFYSDYDRNIGIGTTSIPNGYKLAVEGKAIMEEVKVEASPWPDYVFEGDYELKSLEETESYIQENKHLPDMPSAQEVAENGILIGEMNAKLLLKIEEMTLYMINQDKRIKELEARLEEEAPSVATGEKMEELTLHLIEQNKKIEQQQRDIQELKKKIK